MKSIIKMLGLAFFATLAFSAMAAASAAAAEELFLVALRHVTELLFTGTSLLGLLRGLNNGVVGTISCELDLVHGWLLNKSPLAHRVKIKFHTKCEETVGTLKEKCTEPIEVKESLAELGLLLLPSRAKDVVLLLAPSDGTKVFAEPKCGTFGTTTVEGAVIGEIPETVNGKKQIGVAVEEILLVFEAENKTQNQRYTTLDLLGVEMTKAELSVAGSFGGKASEEDLVHLKSDGPIEICIHA
jgi:hypothetical protein